MEEADNMGDISDIKDVVGEIGRKPDDIAKRLANKSQDNRTWDFEGRCITCRKPLTLHLKTVSATEVRLRIEPCPRHPLDSYILWPDDRVDVVREE